MNVSKWGPSGWVFLHTITFNYPENPTIEDKKRYLNFFNNVGTLLPCKYCRDSFNIYTKHLPIDKFIDDREGITYWLYQIHNLVNDKVFKSDSTTFEEVVKRYERFRAGCKKINKHGNKKKSYGTCGIPKKTELNNKNINQFITRAENKYRPIVKNYIKNLMINPDNPNKEPHKNRINK